MTRRLSLGLMLLLAPAARADEPAFDPYDQSKVALEVDTDDPNKTKIVLLAGSKSHGPGDHEFFAGCSILKKCLEQTPNVHVVMARDGWPKNEAVFKGAKAVVFYMDGRGGHPIVKNNRMELVQKLMDDKAGFVCLHYAVDYDKKPGEKILTWMGGFYDAEISINPHWDADFKALPEHPITRGVKPFKIRDEWYYNMRFVPEKKNVTPILSATPPDKSRTTKDSAKYPGREEVVAWAFKRENGGHGFGFTGGHTHKNWANDDFRKLVVNAILWSAGVEVPKEGAAVKIEPADVQKNLDQKNLGKKK